MKRKKAQGELSDSERGNAPPSQNAEPPLKTSETLLLNQITLHVESVRATMTQQLAWFAFACTLNATAIALILKEHTTRFTIIPSIFLVGAIGAVLVGVVLHYAYKEADRCVNSLLCGFETKPPSPIALKLLLVINGSILATAASMGIGWVCVLYHGPWPQLLQGK